MFNMLILRKQHYMVLIQKLIDLHYQLKTVGEPHLPLTPFGCLFSVYGAGLSFLGECSSMYSYLKIFAIFCRSLALVDCGFY